MIKTISFLVSAAKALPNKIVCHTKRSIGTLGNELQRYQINKLLQPQTMFRQFVRHKRIEYNPPVRVHLQDGNARSSTAVLDRFMRLYNGLWIRPLVGRHRKLWKKSFRRQNRLRDHVFCTRRQCEMLDQMVTKEYKMRRYYPEDPYEPYQSKQHRPEDRYKPPPFLP